MLIILSVVAVLLFSLLCWRVYVRVARCSAMGRFVAVSDDVVGVAVVVERVESVAQICRLLACDLSTCEVVVVDDFTSRRELLSDIIHYFGLLKVSYVDRGELCSGGVRNLYRSRKRLYRRLVLVERQAGEWPSSLQIGASLANRDFVLALPRGKVLRSGAVETLMYELQRRSLFDVDRVVSRRGERFVMLRREWALLERASWRNIDRASCVKLYRWILKK